jgi:hypothetical protein
MEDFIAFFFTAVMTLGPLAATAWYWLSLIDGTTVWKGEITLASDWRKPQPSTMFFDRDKAFKRVMQGDIPVRCRFALAASVFSETDLSMASASTLFQSSRLT